MFDADVDDVDVVIDGWLRLPLLLDREAELHEYELIPMQQLRKPRTMRSVDGQVRRHLGEAMVLDNLIEERSRSRDQANPIQSGSFPL